jgi:hypothetical protein
MTDKIFFFLLIQKQIWLMEKLIQRLFTIQPTVFVTTTTTTTATTTTTIC